MQIEYYDDKLVDKGVISEAVKNIAIVEEAEGVTPHLKATLIKSGFSINKVTVPSRRKRYQRYYPADTIREAAKNLPDDGIPIFIAENEHDDPLTFKKEFGVMKDFRVTESGGVAALDGDIYWYKDQQWVVDRMKTNPKVLDLSIEGKGKYRFGESGGKLVAAVHNLGIPLARLVKKGAAGGSINDIRESEEGDDEMDKFTIEEAEVLIGDKVRKEVQAEAGVKAKDAEIKTLTEAAEKDKKEIKELKEATAKAESKELIESCLPDAVKEAKEKDPLVKVRERLYTMLEGETDEAKVKEAIKGEMEYVTLISGELKTKGATAAEGKETDGLAKLQESADDMFGVGEEKPKEDK